MSLDKPNKIYSIKDNIIRLPLLVKAQAKQSRILEISQDRLKITVQALATEGKANKELISIIAKELNIKKQNLYIATGIKSPLKIIHLPINVLDKLDNLILMLKH